MVGHVGLWICGLAGLTLGAACDGSGDSVAGSVSGNPIESVCNASAARIFSQCNKANPADVTAIQNFFAHFDMEASNADIQAETQGGLSDRCVEGVGEATLTAQDASEFNSSLNATSGCQNTLSTVQEGLDQL